MMPQKKHYSYTNMSDTPQHGEIIESSYLLGEKGPKSRWTRVLEVVVLLLTVVGCAWLAVFLFHNGNHHTGKGKQTASHPHTPVGASSSSDPDDPTLCRNVKACLDLNHSDGPCCPTDEGVYLACCD